MGELQIKFHALALTVTIVRQLERSQALVFVHQKFALLSKSKGIVISKSLLFDLKQSQRASAH